MSVLKHGHLNFGCGPNVFGSWIYLGAAIE
jgi:hypothetical protein